MEVLLNNTVLRLRCVPEQTAVRRSRTAGSCCRGSLMDITFAKKGDPGSWGSILELHSMLRFDWWQEAQQQHVVHLPSFHQVCL